MYRRVSRPRCQKLQTEVAKVAAIGVTARRFVFPAEKGQKMWKGSLLLVKQTNKQKKKTLIKEDGLQDRM